MMTGVKIMPILELTDEQVLELVRQLPPDKQALLFRHLLRSQWSAWEELSRYGETRVRRVAAQRGLDWDAMSEGEREAFIDNIVHESEG